MILSSRPRSAKDEDVNILLLDLEGVMTRGYLFGSPNMTAGIAVGAFFLHALGNDDGRYSEDARRYVEELVTNHNFRIVLITRHGGNESETLTRRLESAGIENDWFYSDPDAIGEQSKDDGIRDWLSRNRHIPMERIVCVEDHPEHITCIPVDRIVKTDTAKGMVYRDYKRILSLVGKTITPGARATGPQTPPPPRA